MYAIIETGSKQYMVKEKDVIAIERTGIKPGKEFSLGKVLLVKAGHDVHIGQPHLKDFKVEARALKDIRAKKVIAYKQIRREDSRWKKGHRQNQSLVEIVKISGAKSVKKEEAKTKSKK